ncbi:membrane protein [Candidatus Endoriftia persephone str. Guaymas]|jgi:hypothetical protein|uniref:Uncharacterized protein n=3 Tax=Gammaproteobacteria TaxID=1236 RepID=G2FDZ3_9GAMM|nr:DUF6763 family protein [Candidatus Endoriftia persephone]EGV52340.1 hypothetical protein Rifp1Sym_ak00210 [endosymbiont of Riftia pachyptila (vent Ph05)]EGW54977.1 hypothetical protein TevJSym_ag00550 [endosymbiont of Tevnia jerichonana (vent Tica)]MBA1332916.1 membrane protein [Candidatus Endoriftia persephone str. Guaymas]USF87869.1 hypothetical protein L0Y14_01060 [Candidatus Endoriftia persephone]
MNTTMIKIGDWFRTNEMENLEVVAFDPEEGLVEVQFYDGTVEEYDLEAWEALDAKQIAPPEDWSGSYDLSRDDYGVDLDKPAGNNHINPLDHLDEQD